MAKLRLDERRVDAPKPRKTTYDARDRELKGFGVRVLPSGAKRFFVHSQHDGRRGWKIVGQAGAIGVDEVREQARALVAAFQKGNADEALAPPDTPFDKVGDEVFRRYARHWKPSTLKVNRSYYRNHILPWFLGRPISEISSHDVQQWFASLHEIPVAADRSVPILSVIMRQAEVYGYRRRAPTRARASSDTGAKGENVFCRRRNSVGWARCWNTTKPTTSRPWPSFGCCCSLDAAGAR